MQAASEMLIVTQSWCRIIIVIGSHFGLKDIVVRTRLCCSERGRERLSLFCFLLFCLFFASPATYFVACGYCAGKEFVETTCSDLIEEPSTLKVDEESRA